MIEIYEGDGKGKTTASVGLAVRAVGRSVPVIFAQFLKDGSSGELKILRSLPGVTVLTADTFFGFVFRMSEEEKVLSAASCARLFADIRGRVDEICRAGRSDEEKSSAKEAGDRPAEIRALIVLDESLHAIHYGFLDEDEVIGWLKSLPEDIEVVLTGRNPSDKLIEAADYVSEIRKKKHPFDRGVTARCGVEQ